MALIILGAKTLHPVITVCDVMALIFVCAMLWYFYLKVVAHGTLCLLKPGSGTQKLKVRGSRTY